MLRIRRRLAWSPMPVVVVAAVGVAIAVTPAALGAVSSRQITSDLYTSPSSAEFAWPTTVHIRDTVLTRSQSVRATRTLAAASWWGGRFTTTSGETVTIYASDSFGTRDPSISQSWGA